MPKTLFKVDLTKPISQQELPGHNRWHPDIPAVKLSVVHVLSGPIRVEGAEPGDILVVDLLDVGTLPGDEWGFTGIFDRSNGGGFLTDHYPKPAKAIWDIQGIYAKSRHIPGVRFAGI